MMRLGPLQRLPRRGARFARRVLGRSATQVQAAARAQGIAARRRLRRLGPRRARVAQFDAARDDLTAQRIAEALAERERVDDARVVIAVPARAPGSRAVLAAVGLSRQLGRLGGGVMFAGPGQWHQAPATAEVYVSLVPDLDPVGLPADCVLVGWVLDAAEWVALPTLGLYDLLACASRGARSEIERVFPGPTMLLPEALDEGPPAGHSGQRHGAVAFSDGAAVAELGDLDIPFALYGPLDKVPPGLAAHAAGPADAFVRPALYRQAALVVAPGARDVLASLAAGALPLVSAAQELPWPGLEEVPRFADAEELRVLARRYLADEPARTALAGRLAAAVTERHTYRQRAVALRDACQELPEPAGRMMVGFWPDYRATNPYQRLLYAAAPERDAVAVPAANPVALADRCTRRGQQFVYHLHWTSPILGPARTEEVAELRCKAFLADVDRILVQGGRLVWTVHNVVPHEARFPAVEAHLGREIAERAHAIHVLCPETVAAAAEHYPLPEHKVHVVAHPGYVDVYANLVDPARARAELGLEPGHTVLLAFGGIRAYKGLEDLLDAFEVVARQRPEYRLVIAGQPGRWDGVAALARRCRANPRVLTHFEAVPDDELQRYFNACDVVVLPHRRVLNSGALLLALSFGRPVIAPRTGCLAPLLNDDVGVGFAPEQRDLAGALAQAERLKDPRYRRAAFATAQRYPHRELSARFFDVLSGLG